ncbi:ImmA/IrrE family metallo-endopeptidase [Pectobacterium carotovorum]|uniref:ImmA/IrrE family metallo-endopeptidase n=1 Tax=Pectobacterium TaxID=122277 RepID=UPI000CD0AAC4|nr:MULTISPECIES: ImmA/IrrE family metallo-endopeptidase [Pectobacterium]MBA0192492.1 ImmA/IrrE family metallo-endopeptidase [Pectobacterium carotovorum]MBA0202395.1 ImmA/IrrE family metallo-endopeptidase [Pectobacterium carotovorum]MCH4995654.1 ImmA/IrrE family metallo-endopeptidase [Pectobacterium carotovorum]POE02177.1 toxin [Pectobacterium odoriferum]
MSYAANSLLDRYWDRRLPVDPLKIAEAWGARVEALRESAYNNDGLSGLAVIKNGEPRIYFDSNEYYNRQRFTIAHELGHHVLGHTQDGEYHRDNVENYSTGIRDYREVEANQFAAELLMPEDAIRQLVTREGVTSTLRLANIFNVSEAAMHWRLKGLGMVY